MEKSPRGSQESPNLASKAPKKVPTEPQVVNYWEFFGLIPAPYLAPISHFTGVPSLPFLRLLLPMITRNNITNQAKFQAGGVRRCDG